MSKRYKNFPQVSNNSALHSGLSVRPMKIEEKPKIKSSASENIYFKKKPNLKLPLENKIDGCVLKPEEDPNMTNLLHAKDSLESLIVKTENHTFNPNLPSCSSAHPSVIPPKSNLNDSSKSSTAPSSKSGAWDHHEKTPQKLRNKTKDKRKKGKKCQPDNKVKIDIEAQNIDVKGGDEKEKPDLSEEAALENYAFGQTYRTKSSRSVVFTTEVAVVYFNGENVVYEAKEPLKKELEQQIRNKEMRKGHFIT